MYSYFLLYVLYLVIKYKGENYRNRVKTNNVVSMKKSI